MLIKRDESMSAFQPVLPGMGRLKRVKPPEPETDHTPAIMMPMTGLHRAINENQFKNSFHEDSEPGVGKKDEGYMSARVNAEEALFGVDPRDPADARPIYGYIDSKSDSLSHRHESVYGDANVHLKWPEKKSNKYSRPNATTTAGDSLNMYERMGENNPVRPQELTKKHTPINTSTAPYREVQWHKHPTPREDITAVNLNQNIRRYSNFDSLDKEMSDTSQTHKAYARQLREAGLPSTTPVISRIQFSTVTPSLFNSSHIRNSNAVPWPPGGHTLTWPDLNEHVRINRY
jgi:hypothetical protein